MRLSRTGIELALIGICTLVALCNCVMVPVWSSYMVAFHARFGMLWLLIAAVASGEVLCTRRSSRMQWIPLVTSVGGAVVNFALSVRWMSAG